MYPNLNSGPGYTSPAWRIFITPGILILRWQYLFPKAGDVFGSGRRLNNPFAQILSAAFFWLLVAAFLTGVVLGNHRTRDQGGGIRNADGSTSFRPVSPPGTPPTLTAPALPTR
ncbi:hypothetical protein [Methylobacterium iners]|uniref:Uncharacterized protein n=1 Tax=Methylobacterium iners TaxID=418707 RepID=A0ABQ4RQU7_9HYPH|nr:hypothetical protein [Methylobacterium iners]GJD93143.1 hypothetical protein OCOJLMKI_0333 [Methylobacterium iners]